MSAMGHVKLTMVGAACVFAKLQHVSLPSKLRNREYREYCPKVQNKSKNEIYISIVGNQAYG